MESFIVIIVKLTVLMCLSLKATLSLSRTGPEYFLVPAKMWHRVLKTVPKAGIKCLVRFII